MSIASQPGGMHLIFQLKNQHSDRLLSARMRESGLYAEALADWTMLSEAPAALLVNFTNIGSQSVAEHLAKRILQLM